MDSDESIVSNNSNIRYFRANSFMKIRNVNKGSSSCEAFIEFFKLQNVGFRHLFTPVITATEYGVRSTEYFHGHNRLVVTGSCPKFVCGGAAADMTFQTSASSMAICLITGRTWRNPPLC